MASKNIAIACQGGGSHAAYAAGVLPTLLPQFENLQMAGAKVAGRERDGLRLVGISGTSGGAVTALLGWYGYLTGGVAEAERRLTAFWDSNTAQMPGEAMWNTTFLSWANSLPYDLKFSPYQPPLREVETMITELWPPVANMLGSMNHWMRADYFELGSLIRPHVDFALVGALGDFCSVPLEIKRWLAVDMEARVYDPASPRSRELVETRRLLEQRIEHKLAMLHTLRDRMRANGVPAGALLSVALGNWQVPQYRFEPKSLGELAAAIQQAAAALPQLLIGAVEIDRGRFTAFSSERSPSDGGISLGAVLASAALPWLFRAQKLRQLNPDSNELETHSYWDGLFSQNPPIKDFLSGVVDDAKKPDGIWVVQINPNDFHIEQMKRGVVAEDALSGSQIWHTRDALSGNLSLNQELSFIQSINKRVASGANRPDREDKHIQVHRIVLDGAAVEAAMGGRKMGVYSKLDRGADLKNALVAHGREQGARFLALRDEVENASESLGTMLRTLAAPAGEPGTLMGVLPAIREDKGVSDARLIIDGLTVHRKLNGDAEQQLASVHWHTLGASVDGSEVEIEGNTGLFEAGAGRNWRLSNVFVEAPAAGE